MIKLDYEKSLDYANQNYEKIINLFPFKLREREDKLLNKLVNSNYGSLKKLELLYSEMDVIYEFIQRFAICKRGCNHCCSYEIAISDLEVQYIKTKIKSNKIKANSVESKCPFLKNQICSIYDYRPFLCRRHLSITDTSEWCHSDICNNYIFPLIKLSEIDKCYAYLIGTDGINSIKDIRKAFGNPKNIHFEKL